jgi:prepilin-type N-terminal cleavage/methylation domain-containing protein
MRRGFTLIEVMIAVMILGLLAGLATWSFSGPLRRARFEEAMEQIRYLDSTSRRLARETGRRVEMVIDAGSGVVSRGDYSAQLPAGVRVERVVTLAGEQGAVTRVGVSAVGLSPSYALRLAGADWRRWVFVSGLSGEVRVISDDAQVAEIFEVARSSGRGDAD